MIFIYIFLMLLCIGFAATIMKWLCSTAKRAIIFSLFIITLPITIPYLIIKAFRDGARNKKLIENLKLEIDARNFLEALHLIKVHNPEDLEATMQIIKSAEVDIKALKDDIKIRYFNAIELGIKDSLAPLTGSNFLELSSLLKPLQSLYDQYYIEEGDLPSPQEIVEAKVKNKELDIQIPYTQSEENSVTLVRRHITDDFAVTTIEI